MMNKLSKWAMIPLLTGALTLPQVAQAEEQPINVFVDNNQIQFDQNPVIYGDITLVPLRGVFEKLGAEVEWDQSTQTVTVTKDNKAITLKNNSKDAFINNTLHKLDTEPQLLNNRIMVPLRFISETLDAKVAWDGNTRTINISQQESKEIKSDNTTTENENSEALTLSNALKKALAYSYDIKNATKEIDKADETRDDLSQYFRYSTPFGTGNTSEESQVRQIYLQYISANDKVRKAERDLEITKDQVTYQVKEAYNDILLKEENLQLSKKALAIEQLNFDNAKVQLNQGVISQIQYLQLENKLEEKKKSLDASTKALQQAKIKLNQLMGVNNDDTYSLVDAPEFAIMEDVDVDYHITKTLEVHPTIFELELAQKAAQDSVNLHYFSGTPGNSYDVKKLTVTTVSNQLGQARDSISEGIRKIYLNIKSLEDQYAILQTNLDNAEKNLQVAKSQYQVGQTTEFDLRQKELQVADLEAKIQETIITLDNLHSVFEKPWVSM